MKNTLISMFLLIFIGFLSACGSNSDKGSSLSISIGPGLEISESDSAERFKYVNLSTPKINQFTAMSYSQINIDEIENTDGSFKSNMFSFHAYTFYLNNMTKRSFSYQINITDFTLNLPDMIRVMVITEDQDGNKTTSIYRKNDSVIEEGLRSGSDLYPLIFEDEIDFESDALIVNKTVENNNELVKFSIVIWVEGNDPNSVSDMQEGTINIEMKFLLV